MHKFESTKKRLLYFGSLGEFYAGIKAGGKLTAANRAWTRGLNCYATNAVLMFVPKDQTKPMWHSDYGAQLWFDTSLCHEDMAFRAEVERFANSQMVMQTSDYEYWQGSVFI
jgi:hypothetical protein